MQIIFQDALLADSCFAGKKEGYVMKRDGVYAHGNRRIYNRLIKFTMNIRHQGLN